MMQLLVATLLAALPSSRSAASSPTAYGAPLVFESLFVEAKEDCRKVPEILEHVGNGAPEMQKTRTEVLRKAFEAIAW